MVESLRVEEACVLGTVQVEAIDELSANYASPRVRRFLQGLRKGLLNDEREGDSGPARQLPLQSTLEEEQALREITQEIVLAASGGRITSKRRDSRAALACAFPRHEPLLGGPGLRVAQNRKRSFG